MQFVFKQLNIQKSGSILPLGIFFFFQRLYGFIMDDANVCKKRERERERTKASAVCCFTCCGNGSQLDSNITPYFLLLAPSCNYIQMRKQQQQQQQLMRYSFFCTHAHVDNNNKALQYGYKHGYAASIRGSMAWGEK